MKTLVFSFVAILTLGACAAGGAEGDACSSDADCADGLECHFDELHSGHDHGEDEDHGMCEAHEDHDHDTGHDDHDDEDHEDEETEGE